MTPPSSLFIFSLKVVIGGCFFRAARFFLRRRSVLASLGVRRSGPDRRDLERIGPGREIAFRVAVASPEYLAAGPAALGDPALDQFALFAFGTGDAGRFRGILEGLGRLAIRESGASQEFSETPELDDHRLAAFFADLVRLFFGELLLGDLHVFFGQVLGERLVESADYLTPVAFAFGGEVEVLLHFGGELYVQDLGEIFLEHLG